MDSNKRECSKCNILQTLHCFREYDNHTYSTTCKKCLNEMDKWRKQNMRNEKANSMVTCEKCHNDKPLKQFAKLKKHYKKKICLSCYPIFLKEQKTEWCKKEHNTNMNYRIKKSIAARLRNVLHEHKTTSTMNYIGCNILFFREWLEYNFTEEMNWNNYGVYWSIDHVIPVCKFDLTMEKDKYKCWNWSNMMPVTVHYNASKKSSIDLDQVSYIVNKLERFKEEGSTTKWFSEEFLITSQIDTYI